MVDPDPWDGLDIGAILKLVFGHPYRSDSRFRHLARGVWRRLLNTGMVPEEGVEPSRLTAPDPKSGASTNSATRAFVEVAWIIGIPH